MTRESGDLPSSTQLDSDGASEEAEDDATAQSRCQPISGSLAPRHCAEGANIMADDNSTTRTMMHGHAHRWLRHCNHGDIARRRAEEISAQLACAIRASRPVLAADFDFHASVRLTPDDGGCLLSFHCTRDEVRCFCGTDTGTDTGTQRQPMLSTLIATGQMLN